MKHVLIALALAFALIPTLTQPADAATEYDMVFPVLGDVEFDNTWGNARSGGRRHQGTDIMADKLLPVVAVSDGVIDWVHDGTRRDCCALGITHDDGWTSYYIHMNNDTPGTDDRKGWGFAPGLEEGDRVAAGQLIGWVGDSGNAEHTAPHIHFELHKPNGTKVNPYHSLVAATQLETYSVNGTNPSETSAAIATLFEDLTPTNQLVVQSTAAATGRRSFSTVRVTEDLMLVLGSQPGGAEFVRRLLPDTTVFDFVVVEDLENKLARLEAAG